MKKLTLFEDKSIERILLLNYVYKLTSYFKIENKCVPTVNFVMFQRQFDLQRMFIFEYLFYYFGKKM